MKYPIPALAPALVAAVLAFAPAPALSDDSARAEVERLMPQLMSKDDSVRKSAEKSLMELGPAGRSELERVACDDEPLRAIAALRVLQRRDWPDLRRERAVAPDGATARGADELFERMRLEMDELRRRVAAFEANGLEPSQAFDWPDGTSVRAKASGEFVENDRTILWSIAEDGRVKVTTKDGATEVERTIEAKNLAELREKHPAVAKRLESVLPRSVRRSVRRASPLDGESSFDGTAPAPAPVPAPADESMGRMTPGVGSISQPTLGIEWSPVPDVLAAQLEIPRGMVVERVVDGTLAQRLGLQRHDVLLELNGSQVGASADVRTALASIKPDDKMTATVLRGGRRKTLDAAR